MPKNYISINASAGSGKTFALVQRLLMICLKHPHQPDAIRHILALTFTNKAANEMKERIFDWLKEFTQQDYYNSDKLKQIKEKFEAEGIHITLDELHWRSQKVLNFILHHYSTLNIGTIDKFNSRLVRSFSYELGLAQNFNLEIQAEPLLLEAVDKMLEQIGEENKVSEAFLDFINYNLDNNERVNLNKTLYSSAKKFLSDVHYEELKKNDGFDWNAYENTKETIRKDLAELRNNSLDIAENVLQLLKEKNLEQEDFAGGKTRSIAKFFFEIIKFYRQERDGFPFPGNENSAMEVFLSGASSKSKNRESEIFEIMDYLIENRSLLIRNYIQIRKKEKMLTALLPLRVNKDIQEKLLEIEQENDLVLLSKFNILINENLKNEPSSFIYEKIGNQYQHYFFDEFQDTSKMQWENFIPLRDHTVSMENTTFTIVGDPKQSIYRFRGGDSQIMLDINSSNEKTLSQIHVENLEMNRRSAKNIVKFNNELYQYLADFSGLNVAHQKIFGLEAQQTAISEIDGRVKVNLFESSAKETFYKEIADRMQSDIQECLDNDFNFSDITILCRGNFEIFTFSQLLSNIKVNYNGENVYIKTISEKGLTLDLSATLLALIEFLKWFSQPNNAQYLVKMMYFLNTSGKIKMEDFTQEIAEVLEIKNKKETEAFLEQKYGLKLQQTDFPHLNLYNFVEYYLKEFAVEDQETDFLLNFLEMTFNYSQNTSSTLKDFLKYWDEEGAKTTIQASENVDAIEIMTIHKAKGLEFPVVFLPMRNSHKDADFNSWFGLDDHEHLKSVNISGFDTVLENYDEELQLFNSENLYQNKIDRFCIQYVATTRPVEQLFLYLEKPYVKAKGEESEAKIEILNFIREKNLNDENEFDLFETNPEILKKRSLRTTKLHDTQSIQLLKEEESTTNPIKIATPSKNYQNRVEKVRIGIFTHEILAKIYTEQDVGPVLEDYEIKGIITQEEKAEIFASLLEIIRKYPDYFKEGQKVINERDVMISENGQTEIYRPDRILVTDNGYFIIDFKTGDEKEKHQKQIDTYITVLEKLGKKVSGSEIIYV